MRVTLIRAWPDRQDEAAVELADGATLADALDAVGWAVPNELPVGIWGKVQPRDKVLRAGDRVEIYRPLVADPKTARRKRAGS